jgi:hypothetical protein
VADTPDLSQLLGADALGTDTGTSTPDISQLLAADALGTDTGTSTPPQIPDPYNAANATPEELQKQGQDIAAGATGGTNSPVAGAAGGAGDASGILSALSKAVGGDANLAKLLTALAGAGIFGASAASNKGIAPLGLTSAGGTNRFATRGTTQTGARGTGGKGQVRYFSHGGKTGAGLGYLQSAEDGMADTIPATIDNKQPAKLSGGEFVIPADVVSHLGNGNSEHGAQQLHAFMDRIRHARTGTKEQGKQINPKKMLPA